MKTSLSRRQLNRRASLTGLGVSILLHGAVAGIFAKFYEELKPISEEKSVKIALNTFTPPAAPLPPAPTPPAPPPPAPPRSSAARTGRHAASAGARTAKTYPAAGTYRKTKARGEAKTRGKTRREA